MTTYVIVVVNSTRLYPGIDPYIPQPAMGNMLPTTKGYEEKLQEKRQKIEMELVSDPLFAYPTEVLVSYFTPPSSIGTRQGYTDKTLFRDEALSVEPEHPEDYVLTGVNPWVDRALVASYLAKNGKYMKLPFWCKPDTEVLDVWKFLTGTSDWRVAAKLWDLPKDPIDATVELLKRL